MSHWRHRPKGRSLHLIDIENLVGGSAAAGDEVEQTLAEYDSVLAFRRGDHVVIASGRGLAVAAGLAYPGARLLVASGVNGADLRLIDWARPVAAVADAYDRVVIGSGDAIFAPLGAELRVAGLAVCVVSRPESLAASLRRIAGYVGLLPCRLAAA